MKTKSKILIISSIVILILSSLFLIVIKHLEDEQQNQDAHNSSFVKNCIPKGSDGVVPSISIENKTHVFDLGNCIWNEKTR